VKLEGIHHVTAITGDGPGNVEFYTAVLGLRMVKKSVNQDEPSVYHLYYADEDGAAGSVLTFFEYPGVERGVPGAGMVHRIVWRVAAREALDFWEERLKQHDADVRRTTDTLLFADPEGLEHELLVDGQDEPLRAHAPDVPAEVALCGFAGVRAYSSAPELSERLLGEALGFRRAGGESWEVRGEQRGGFYAYDPAPPEMHRRQGGGSVHHVAFACLPDDQEAWRLRVLGAGGRPTPIIERFYFKSVYFREPSGVLFEIATIGPGFAIDEDAGHLGERLSLPPRLEPMRPQLEGTLRPLPYPPAWRREEAATRASSPS
jgi:glyoxalase family protein